MGKLNKQRMAKMTDTEKQQRDAEAAAVMQFVQKAQSNMPAMPAKTVQFAKIKDTTNGFVEAVTLLQKA